MDITRSSMLAWLPERAHSDDAGLDLRSPVEVTVMPYSAEMIDTMVAIKLPKGTVGFIKNRSSMFKRGLITDGTIDEGYRGSVKVILRNLTNYPQSIHIGDRIAQLVIVPVLYEECNEVYKWEVDTERGTGGFGSTGR